jgi:hypothetical protein
MTNEEYDDVRQLWVLTHAINDFESVKVACHLLLTEHTNREHPIYRTLLTAAYVAYGRPFKAKGKLAIDENLVPAEHLHFHGQMIEHRDKIHAHNDRSGMPLADRFNINRVTIIRQFGGHQITADTIQALPATIVKMNALAVCMCRIVEGERDKLYSKHAEKFPVGEAYYLNVTDSNGKFALPVEAS